MESIKLRKKKFISFAMALLLVAGVVVGGSTFAASYTSPRGGMPEYLYEGDVITPNTGILVYSAYPPNYVCVIYEDYEGNFLCDTGNVSSITIEGLASVAESMSASDISKFKCWKVISEELTSGGGTNFGGEITLQAVAYTEAEKHSISYELDGGSNASSNPKSFYEGKKGMTLADATKDGYTFEGWYTESTYVNKVTSVPTSSTSDITLYAKFTKATSTDNSSSTGTVVAPKTGDTSSASLLFILLAAGLVMVGATTFSSKKKEN